MKWNHQGIPQESGSCLISVQKQRQFGTSIFNYVAHFDSSNGLWYEYNPFTDVIGQQITDYVTGWASEVGVVAG